jgi:3-hydroxyacyl-CoA dehydrogenase/enoyl-CoA hydratase/3-hydroxybutyryl-CoA epimerase
MSERNMIRWEHDGEGIVVLTLDDPAQSANTMNEAYRASMADVVKRLEAERDEIAGVVITSAKKTFFAGGDLRDLLTARKEDTAVWIAATDQIKGQLRRLEMLGRPVVAAINGAALGGGLEIALACHRRIALDTPSVQLGLPEVGLGLLPGGGGVVRSVRLLGIEKALTKVLLQGQRYRPGKALEVGLVDQLVGTVEELVPAAKAWIRENPHAAQPWDRPGYRLPGGSPSTPALAANLPAFPANLRKQLKGANYPAPRNILAAAVEGAQVDIATAFAVEGEYFVDLVMSQVAKNMIQAFFFDMQSVNSRPRPAGCEPRTFRKAVVLGAGMMGASIAYVCARSGMEVVLKDVSLDAAQRGKDHSASLLAKQVARGRTTQEKADAALARITPTADVDPAAGADLVIEAVFEDPALKAKVFAEVEPVVAADALLATNTSTLPITVLAEGVQRQEDFIGLHFFSPVDKMPLVEIITGGRTSAQALHQALDVVRQIGKTPIIVNDSRGFFTSRVIGTFVNEGVAMLAEGVPAATIEQASAQAGYPASVLQLMDELTLTLPRKIREESRAATEAMGQVWTGHPADAVIDRMIDEFDRKGRSSGAGFYDYDKQGKRVGLWPGLRDAFSGQAQLPIEDLKERMLFAEAIETVKCFDEGVLTTTADANIGSILGIGFPGWTGGVIQYINGYPGGPAGFTARARELAERYGDRFTPPASLVAKAEADERIA